VSNVSIGIADEIQIADDLEWISGAGQVRNLQADLDRLGGQFFTKSGLFGRERGIRRVRLGVKKNRTAY
jgi:hypothetical protein